MAQSTDEVILKLVMGMDSKIDDLTKGQANLDARMETVEESVNDLVKTVRGSDGSNGLVTEVAVIRAKLESSLIIQNAHEQSTAQVEEKSKVVDKDRVTWSYLIDKLIFPIGVSGLLWFLLTVLPKWIEHTGAP